MKHPYCRRTALWLTMTVLACLLSGCGPFPTEEATAAAAAPLTPAQRRITTSRHIQRDGQWFTRRTLTYIQDGERITVTWDETE